MNDFITLNYYYSKLTILIKGVAGITRQKHLKPISTGNTDCISSRTSF